MISKELKAFQFSGELYIHIYNKIFNIWNIRLYRYSIFVFHLSFLLIYNFFLQSQKTINTKSIKLKPRIKTLLFETLEKIKPIESSFITTIIQMINIQEYLGLYLDLRIC